MAPHWACAQLHMQHERLALHCLGLAGYAVYRPRTGHRLSTAVRNWLKTSGLKLQRGHTSPSISWWQTSAERHALSRPSAAAGGGRRPACVSDMSDSLGVKVPCVT